MATFVGRARELTSLRRELDRVKSSIGDGAPGRCVLVRGRRRVGKSRLVEELCETAGVPSVFFAASRQGDGEPALFAEEVLLSDLPGRDLFAESAPRTWDGTLRLLAAAVADDEPTIVVIDELPYLVADDPSIEATLQKRWDRLLSKKPVLLILVGSDLAMMESLNTHGRAFFQRGTEMVVPPLSPAAVAEVVGVDDAASAFDAYLVTGGLPLICAEWGRGRSMAAYLREALDEPTSALIVSAERALAAEFPSEVQAGDVLRRIGSGERTFSRIERAGGGMQAASLARSLDILQAKRLVARELPLSTKASRNARYRVSDPYLSFWLRFIGSHLPEVERGRGDRVVSRIEAGWQSWRGKAIEPVVREALARLSPVAGLPAADVVGGWWTRTNTPEVDLVGADRGPVARQLSYVGTIKWRDGDPVDQGDLAQLAAVVDRLPGASIETPIVAVGRRGVTARGAAAAFGPDDLLEAWPEP